MFRTLIAAAVVASGLVLSACESGPTPYQQGRGAERGYSEQRIETDRYRITFRGNSLTDKDTVENYMLYRAAELTLQQGFDHFTVADRDTDKQRRVRSSPGFYGERLSYAFYVPRRGWVGVWEPYWEPGYYSEATQYSAQAEIILGKGPKGADPNAFDARDVEKNLGPLITRPPQ